jgi:hypothetical protein
MKVGSCGMG